MKNKIIFNLSSLCIFILGTITLILSVNYLNNVKWLFFFILLSFGISEIINYFVNKKSLSFPLGVCSINLSLILLLLNILNEPLALSFTLLTWILFVSFTKLTDVNDYLQTNNPLWKWSLFSCLVIILLGVFTSIVCYYTPSTQVYVIGLFFYCIGTIDLLFNS